MKIDRKYLKQILNLAHTPSQLFHEKTKIKKFIKSVDPIHWPQSWKTIYFKTYPRLNQIILPPADDLDTLSFIDILYQRKSERLFGKKALTTQQISNLLCYSVGLRQKDTTYQAGNRFYPSAGGRYPIETYLLSLNSELPKGIYHYNLQENTLEEILEITSFKKNIFLGEWINNASCLLLFTAVFDRTTIKYNTRGYRHVFIETGHIAQNIYLTATGLQLACCGIGGYIDDAVNEMLGIDGITESIVNVIAVGNKKK